jgi:DHA1 family tetracycline resistance protein-like MFS transporter
VSNLGPGPKAAGKGSTYSGRLLKPGLPVVYFTVFIDLVGFGIILPQLPYYAEAFGATGVWVGALLTAYSATQFLGASLLGRLSDRIGRRPVLLASLAGSSASLVLSGLATTLVTLVLARALAGLFGGSIAAAQAYVADSTTPKERARYMGFLGASIGLGFVLGPALGAGLARYGFGTAAFVAAGLAAANFVFGLFNLPETHGPDRRHLAPSRPDLSHLLAALRHPSMGRLLGANFFATLAFVAMEATFALLGEHRFGLDPSRLGFVFTYVGVVIVVVQGGLVGPLAARFGERTLAVAGALLMAIGLGALPLAPGLPGALAALGLLAGGQGLTSPMLSTLLSRAADEDEQGGTLGLGQSLAAAARAVGPLGAGWLFDRAMGAPYAAAAAAMLVAAFLVGTSRGE